LPIAGEEGDESPRGPLGGTRPISPARVGELGQATFSGFKWEFHELPQDEPFGWQFAISSPFVSDLL